ncbi:MAG: class I SAM-dependent methyltransferase [Vicinamibacterales bacterium]
MSTASLRDRMDRLLELTYHAEHEHFWFNGFRRFTDPLLAQATGGRPVARVLDAGCGTGFNLERFQVHGPTWGFDLSARGLAFAHGRGHRRIARASIGAMPFQSGTFDLVTSFDVLQSVPEDVETDAAREFARVLRSGGYLLLSVAALEVLRGRHSALAQELRRYRRPRVRRLLEGAGFVVERLTYTHASLFPLLLPIRTWDRWTSDGEVQAAGDQLEVPSGPVNAGLSAVLAVEAALMRVIDMPFGSSVLCLARKP